MFGGPYCEHVDFYKPRTVQLQSIWLKSQILFFLCTIQHCDQSFRAGTVHLLGEHVGGWTAPTQSLGHPQIAIFNFVPKNIHHRNDHRSPRGGQIRSIFKEYMWSPHTQYLRLPKYLSGEWKNTKTIISVNQKLTLITQILQSVTILLSQVV